MHCFVSCATSNWLLNTFVFVCLLSVYDGKSKKVTKPNKICKDGACAVSTIRFHNVFSCFFQSQQNDQD